MYLQNECLISKSNFRKRPNKFRQKTTVQTFFKNENHKNISTHAKARDYQIKAYNNNVIESTHNNRFCKSIIVSESGHDPKNSTRTKSVNNLCIETIKCSNRAFTTAAHEKTAENLKNVPIKNIKKLKTTTFADMNDFKLKSNVENFERKLRTTYINGNQQHWTLKKPSTTENNRTPATTGFIPLGIRRKSIRVF